MREETLHNPDQFSLGSISDRPKEKPQVITTNSLFCIFFSQQISVPRMRLSNTV